MRVTVPMIKLLFFIVLISCSGTPYRKIQMESHQLANKWVQNKINFLGNIFEQSRDPYYGTPQWSEKCLEENLIGQIIATNHSLRSDSVLYLNQSGEAGFCEGQRYNYVLLVCKGEDFVREYRFPVFEDFQRSISCD